MAEKWSFGRGRASPWFARGMGVPGSLNSEPGGLVGATGHYIGIRKGPSPDRVEQLFGFVTPCRPPVNSTPQVCRGEDSTEVGDFDTSLTLWGAGVNVGRDADSAPNGLEQNQGTAHVNVLRNLRAQLG